MKLTVDDLTVALGGDPVLEDVSATIKPGEFVGLVGPNGAGKTTMLRTLLGAIEPSNGDVRLGDDSVEALSSRTTSRRLAAVPQRTGIAFAFTVREVVGMGRHPHTPRLGRDPDPDRVDAAMERTNVADLADRSIDAVSGGERQRVLLARALAQDAPALLLDEPTASLDVNHQVRTLDLVADLAADDRAVLAAIHDLNLAARYCDRLLLLADGELIARGPPETVLRSTTIESAFDTRAVVRADPVTAAPVVTALPDRTTERDTRVHVVGGGDRAGRVVSTLDEAGFTVTAGVVPVGDTVTDVATARDRPVVTAPPFTAPGDQPSEAATGYAANAAITVVVPGPTVETPTNRRVIEAADRVVTLPDPPEAAWVATARTTSIDDLLTTVTAALADPPRHADAIVTD